VARLKALWPAFTNSLTYGVSNWIERWVHRYIGMGTVVLIEIVHATS